MRSGKEVPYREDCTPYLIDFLGEATVLLEPNNGLTGIFSLLNSYSGRLFLPIPPEQTVPSLPLLWWGIRATLPCKPQHNEKPCRENENAAECPLQDGT